ncbi:36828_t:CDS:10 [Gigaspora margarita]|uniref:36828_t:CDS:1 n=1 Tax=Gigaspora margarita TaxID=4874 RepID=A0ABM8W707_GIGMA|nr:36828_t:CDS:10 [Gigaspora margarita]
METKELLLQLIKKMESGEIIASGDGGEKLFLIDKVSKVEICVGEAEIIEDKYASPGIGKIKYLENNEDNDNFKENFYREKGNVVRNMNKNKKTDGTINGKTIEEVLENKCYFCAEPIYSYVEVRGFYIGKEWGAGKSYYGKDDLEGDCNELKTTIELLEREKEWKVQREVIPIYKEIVKIRTESRKNNVCSLCFLNPLVMKVDIVFAMDHLAQEHKNEKTDYLCKNCLRALRSLRSKQNNIEYSPYGSKIKKEKYSEEVWEEQQAIKNSPNFYQQAPFLTIAEDLLKLIKEDKIEQIIFLSAYDKRKFPNGDERKLDIFHQTFGKIKVIAPYYPAIENQHDKEVVLVKNEVSELKMEDFTKKDVELIGYSWFNIQAIDTEAGTVRPTGEREKVPTCLKCYLYEKPMMEDRMAEEKIRYPAIIPYKGQKDLNTITNTPDRDNENYQKNNMSEYNCKRFCGRSSEFICQTCLLRETSSKKLMEILIDREIVMEQETVQDGKRKKKMNQELKTKIKEFTKKYFVYHQKDKKLSTEIKQELTRLGAFKPFYSENAEERSIKLTNMLYSDKEKVKNIVQKEIENYFSLNDTAEIKDDKNADFINFFKDNLSEFAADSPTEYINPDKKGNLKEFDEEVKKAKKPVRDDTFEDTNQAQETAIREEITSLDLSENGIVKVTKKDKATSLYDSTGKNYIGLQGDLDLSDFTKLKELNLSGNYQLGKVDISKCLALEKLFIISNPYQVINQGQQMEMSNLVVADDYPSFQVLVKFGSRGDNAVENKLVKVNSPNFRLVVKSSADNHFSVGHKSMLSFELQNIFRLFMTWSPNNDYNLYRNDYQKFVDEIAGRNVKAYRKTNASGTALEFEEDRFTPAKVRGGEYEFSKVLTKILNPPPPEKILDLEEEEKKAEFKKYFGNVPENKAEEFLNEVLESVSASEKGEDPDNSQFYVFPSQTKKVDGDVRGGLIKVQVPLGVEKGKKPRFKDLVPYNDEANDGSEIKTRILVCVPNYGDEKNTTETIELDGTYFEDEIKTTSYKEAGKEIVIEEYKETIGEVETSDNSGTNI